MLFVFTVIFLTGNTEENIYISINEVAAANESLLADEDGEYPDWIELYNGSEKSVSLKNYGLSDQKEVPGLWRFPEIEMEPNSYLIIFASGKDRRNPEGSLHANFKINALKESVYLSDPKGRLLSEVEVSRLYKDQTYGRIPGTTEYALLLKGTPGEENVRERGILTKETKEILFSHGAGCYENEILLEMSTSQKEAQIYYTLDGREPDLNAFQYTGEAISVWDRSEEENRYTTLWCTPADFWKDDGYMYDPSPQYKATVVKARMYFPEEKCWSEKIWTNTYLIGADYTMPIVSLSVSEELLFDEETGIYVPGQTMADYVGSGVERASDARLWRGNYSQDTKVLGYLEYFENGNKVAENEVYLRICGAASRGNAQKSFAVYAWGTEMGFSYPLFGEEYVNISEKTIEQFQSIRLRAFGNDWRRSMFRDALSQELVKNLNLGTQGYQPCILLINGEYFGVYELRENRDSKFFEEHFGIAKNNLAKIELFDLSREDADAYGTEFLKLIEEVQEQDLSEPTVYENVCGKLDVEQFMDYMITEQYLCNVDWPENNVIAFKSKETKKDSFYEDGRWRFVLYDLDYAINYPMENNYEKQKESGSYPLILLNALLENKAFRDSYQQRFEELVETVFEPSHAIGILEQFEKEFAPEIEETLKRWNVYQADGTLVKETKPEYWYEKMADLQEFFNTRPDYAKEYFYSTLD